MKSFVFGMIAAGLLVSSLAAAHVGSVPNVPTVPQDGEVVEAAAGDSFHRNVVKAAIKARKEGKISRLELRRLRLSMLSPAFRERAKELAEIQMLSSDQADQIPRVDGQIDWDGLIAFIEKLIPLIIKLIDAIMAISDVSTPVQFQLMVPESQYRLAA